MADKYTFRVGDEEVTVPAWATEDTLGKVAKALNVTEAGSVSAVIKKFGGKGTTDTKTVVGAAGAAAGSLDKVSSSSVLAQKAFDAVAATAEGVGTIGTSLANTGGSFESLNPIIDLATDTLGSFAKMIPIVGDGLAQLIGITGELVKTANTIFDEFLEAFDGVAMQGMGLTTSFVELQKEALKGRISLADLFNVTGRAAEGVIALGGSFDAGVKRFTQIQNILQEDGGPFQMALESFGMGAVDTAEFLGDFIENQKGNLILNTMSNKQLAESAFAVIKNQRQIAELTGTEVDDLKAQQRAVAADMAFQARLQQLRNEGRTQEAFALEQFVANLPTETARQAAKEMQAFGGALATAETNLLNFATDGNLQATIQQGFDEIFATGGKDIEDNLTRLVAPVGDAVAGVATNSDALQAAVVTIGDGTNLFGEVVKDNLDKSKQLLTIQENAGTSLVEQNEKLLQATNDAIAAISTGETQGVIDEFNADLITTRMMLDDLSTELQNLVITAFEPLTNAYASTVRSAIGTLRELVAFLESGGSLADFGKSMRDTSMTQEEVDAMNFFDKIYQYGFQALPFYEGLGDLNFSPELATTETGFFGQRKYNEDGSLKTTMDIPNPDEGKVDAAILAALEKQNTILEDSNKHLKNTEKNTQGPARSF